MNNPARCFWQQCERLYDSNCAPLLLNLQQSEGFSVNLLLMALYLDLCHTPLPSATWSALNQHAEQFERRILRPYRQHRKHLKQQVSPFAYQQILAIELILERALQQQLAVLLPKTILQTQLVHQTVNLTHTNLCHYAQSRNARFDILKPIYSIN